MTPPDRWREAAREIKLAAYKPECSRNDSSSFDVERAAEILRRLFPAREEQRKDITPATPPWDETWRIEQIEWAMSRWHAEVANRPLVNIHRRSLDDTWRHVIRHFGGKPELLIGPDHDDLVVESTESERQKEERDGK